MAAAPSILELLPSELLEALCSTQLDPASSFCVALSCKKLYGVLKLFHIDGFAFSRACAENNYADLLMLAVSEGCPLQFVPEHPKRKKMSMDDLMALRPDRELHDDVFTLFAPHGSTLTFDWLWEKLPMMAMSDSKRRAVVTAWVKAGNLAILESTSSEVQSILGNRVVDHVVQAAKKGQGALASVLLNRFLPTASPSTIWESREKLVQAFAYGGDFAKALTLIGTPNQPTLGEIGQLRCGALASGDVSALKTAFDFPPLDATIPNVRITKRSAPGLAYLIDRFQSAEAPNPILNHIHVWLRKTSVEFYELAHRAGFAPNLAEVIDFVRPRKPRHYGALEVQERWECLKYATEAFKLDWSGYMFHFDTLGWMNADHLRFLEEKGMVFPTEPTHFELYRRLHRLKDGFRPVDRSLFDYLLKKGFRFSEEDFYSSLENQSLAFAEYIYNAMEAHPNPETGESDLKYFGVAPYDLAKRWEIYPIKVSEFVRTLKFIESKGLDIFKETSKKEFLQSERARDNKVLVAALSSFFDGK